MAMPVTSSECAICSKPLEPAQRLVSCPSCAVPMHLTPCAAQLFSTTAQRLMPDQPAPCPACGRTTEWMVLIRSARRLTISPSMPTEERDPELSESSDEAREDVLSLGKSMKEVQLVSQDFSDPPSQSSPAPQPDEISEWALKSEVSARETSAELAGEAGQEGQSVTWPCMSPIGDFRAPRALCHVERVL